MPSFIEAAGLRIASAAVVLAGLAACSPTYDWRDVRLDDGATGLNALLPCKPDRAQRPVALAAGAAEQPLTMIGCERGGATFTLAQLHLDAGLAPGAALAQWRAATLARLKVSADAAPDTPFSVAGALPLTEMRMTAVERAGGGEGGKQVQLRAVWFAAAAEGGGAELYQAAIQGAWIDSGAAETFFSGLRLR